MMSLLPKMLLSTNDANATKDQNRDRGIRLGIFKLWSFIGSVNSSFPIYFLHCIMYFLYFFGKVLLESCITPITIVMSADFYPR